MMDSNHLERGGRGLRQEEEEEAEMEMEELRRGPWTVEEDITLINYIANHGEGRWNSLARCAGLKRTGKSCRLRWLNYLRPDVRRGNITLEEQLLILELHSRWGNRWSKIAQHLPGRTDNEIKNYWRTRVQKHAKQLKCDVNSKQFKDTMRYLWMPRLLERIQASASSSSSADQPLEVGKQFPAAPMTTTVNNNGNDLLFVSPSYTSENSSTGVSSGSDSMGTQVSVSPVSDQFTASYNLPNPDYLQQPGNGAGVPIGYPEPFPSPHGFFSQGLLDFQSMEQNNQWLLDGGDTSGNLWNIDDAWFLQ